MDPLSHACKVNEMTQREHFKSGKLAFEGILSFHHPCNECPSDD